MPAKNVEAYRKFWTGLTKPQRDHLLPQHDNLKSIAAAADAETARIKSEEAEAATEGDLDAPFGKPALDGGVQHVGEIGNDPARLNRRNRPHDRLPAAREAVDHPAHYGGADNPYEVIKVLESWLSRDEFVGFCKGNVIKLSGARGKEGWRSGLRKRPRPQRPVSRRLSEKEPGKWIELTFWIMDLCGWSIIWAAICPSTVPPGFLYDAAPWRAGEDQGSDARLIRYLWKNHHTTPFEAVTFTFEIKAPIFVFRQWHRHRTWSYNELSGRYRELPEEFYIPDPEAIGVQSKVNKQGRDTTWRRRGFDIGSPL